MPAAQRQGRYANVIDEVAGRCQCDVCRTRDSNALVQCQVTACCAQHHTIATRRNAIDGACSTHRQRLVVGEVQAAVQSGSQYADMIGVIQRRRPRVAQQQSICAHGRVAGLGDGQDTGGPVQFDNHVFGVNVPQYK